MASRDEMEKAVEELDGIELGGRAIQARVSLPKDKLPTKAAREKPARRPRGPDGPKIYVGNLPYGVAEDDLKELFAEHGEVVSVYLVKDDDGKDRGFGFITMGNDEAVDVAVAKIDGSFFQGRRLAARRPLAEGEKSEQAAPRKCHGTSDFHLFFESSTTLPRLVFSIRI
jgi:nucleolin